MPALLMEKIEPYPVREIRRALKIFDEVEKRRQISMAMIYPFMQSLREAPFPAPGNTVQIKSFIPDSGTEVIHAVSVLLYPFIWQHTLISIVPQILIDVVMAPTPYLLGVQKHLADEVIDQGDLLVVDLSEGRKKTFIKRIGDEESILPHKLKEEMLQALRNRSDKSSLEELNRIVPEAFLPFFIKTVGHFSKHLVRNGADTTAHFHKRNFCKAIESKSIRHFVKQFIQTQMFDLFIQEVEQRPASQTGFFERKISEYHRKMREKVKKH
ncbi:DENN domain-containing protein 2D [Bagarius yarrelli]|uniref:DENN domain-containing protein 2D n=1 Tax=Bagarius yarrelli TaxID=175774 RepID=A0A556VWX4_BAGYA|nr:DENN domain-containing protein 2D [Bagarius yarrelli]